jgi:hypothetical protein
VLIYAAAVAAHMVSGSTNQCKENRHDHRAKSQQRYTDYPTSDTVVNRPVPAVGFHHLVREGNRAFPEVPAREVPAAKGGTDFASAIKEAGSGIEKTRSEVDSSGSKDASVYRQVGVGVLPRSQCGLVEPSRNLAGWACGLCQSSRPDLLVLVRPGVQGHVKEASKGKRLLRLMISCTFNQTAAVG